MSIVIHHNPDCGTSRNVLAILRALGLLEPGASDDTLLNAMIEHPILVNRPIVCTPKGVRLCRPSETVLDLLDRLPPGPLFKEDGEMILNEEGERLA